MTTLTPKFGLKNGGSAPIGAVNRTMYQKLSDTISVKDFGAVGDGVTDDAPAFQAAIDSFGYGGALYVPEGTYVFNSTVNIPPTAGQETQLNIFGDGGVTFIVPGDTVDSLFNVTGSNVYFTQLGFGNVSSRADKALKIINSPLNAAFSSLIQDCIFVGFNYGIYADGQNYGIQNNFFQNNQFHIYFVNDGRNTYIDNNYMLGGNNGVVFTKTTTQVEGTRITNNTILVTVGNGQAIGLSDGLEIYIAFNILDQTGDNSPAINLNAASTSGTISRIKIISNWICAGKDSYGIFASGNSTYIDVIDNTLNDNGKVILASISYSTVNISKLAFNNFLLAIGNIEYSQSSSVNIEFLMNTDRAGSPLSSLLSGRYNFTSETGIASLTTAQKNAIPNLVGGLIVFDQTLGKLCVYNGTAWQTVTST